jgi:hypothetical protein
VVLPGGSRLEHNRSQKKSAPERGRRGESSSLTIPILTASIVSRKAPHVRPQKPGPVIWLSRASQWIKPEGAGQQAVGGRGSPARRPAAALGSPYVPARELLMTDKSVSAAARSKTRPDAANPMPTGRSSWARLLRVAHATGGTTKDGTHVCDGSRLECLKREKRLSR